MPNQRGASPAPVAILSFHSHSDRSFLDDRELALLSGELRQADIANDLVLVVVTKEMERDGGAPAIEARLAETLSGYDPIVFERVWSPQLVARLRRLLPDKVFIGLRGEHLLLDESPADFFCNGEPRQLLAALIAWLRGARALPPGQILRRQPGDGAARWEAVEPSEPASAAAAVYAPNLRPVVVNPEHLPAARTFSVVGNNGCPYQADARANPLYAGTAIPAQYGRGCAFCTTGNLYEAQPNAVTAASVFEQIRYVRASAPELTRLVLKDQNPFAYLTEVIERCAAEGVGGFSLLLETRAEWFLRNAKRFERALAVARDIDVRLAPFLVGIENFSQPELDRFNKGIRAATNIEFLETLWRWQAEHGAALDLSHAAFGFILFSPWTTLDDLRANLDGIRRTRFDRLRGSVLLARARLYPDTALYYLAQRDGVLVERFASEGDNASRRYGYYPSHPWKHQHADVAHFAALATALAERNGSRDMVNLFQALLDAFDAAGPEWAALRADDVWERYRRLAAPADAARPALAPASDALRARLERLVHPLPLDGPFAGGWQIGGVRAAPGRVELELLHQAEPRLLVELVPRGQGPHFRRSRHYDIRATGRQLTVPQHTALTALAAAIAANDA